MATKKLVAVGVLGIGGFATYSVYTMRNAQPIQGTVHRLKINELPIYQSPASKFRYEQVEEEIDGFTQRISVVRKFVWKYVDATKETRDKVVEKWEISKAHTTNLITRLQEDPNILPKLGFITVTGLGGVVLGYRRSAFRKILYSATGMVAATSLCYPNQAVDVTVSAYNKMIDHAKDMWQSPGSSKKKETTTKQVEEKNKSDSNLGDMGQSKAEDKDMYTTRTS